MAAAGVFTQTMTAGQALTGKAAAPMESSPGAGNSANSASSDSATISANDFLTLLVTEMQNQDPTADADPNQYINQLVEVNSLEQLIGINQTLSTDLGAPSSATSGSSGSGSAAQAAPRQPGPVSEAGMNAKANPPGVVPAQPAASRVSGNLSVPSAGGASEHVARALEQPSHAKSIAGRLTAFEATSLNNRP
jgi:flagellar basal-body rod modification protein FlgD